MTGQILSGILPSIAARYQIMDFLSSVLTKVCFLTLMKKETQLAENKKPA